jgi:hypothetical protein
MSAMILALLLLLQDKPLIKDFVGINGHTVQFKPKVYAPVCRLVRDYHPVEWDLGKDTDVPTTFPFARNRVNWETVYGSWKAEGWDVNVSLMFETIPQKEWKDVPRDAYAYGRAFAKASGPRRPSPSSPAPRSATSRGSGTIRATARCSRRWRRGCARAIRSSRS